MHKRYSGLQILFKVYRETLRIVPLAGIGGVLNYLVEGLIPAVTTIILARFFDNAYLITQGLDVGAELFLYGVLFISVYAFKEVVLFVSSIAINAGIYEKCSHYYNIKLGEKTAKLPMIAFEDSEVLNLQSKAKDCVQREILSQIYMQVAVFTTSGISIIAVVMVLASYSLWFIPISLCSTLPYFVARLIRGKEFYYVKSQQAKKSRRLAYLWGLFNNKQTIKEMRVMGFDNYITDQWIDVRDQVNEELWGLSIKDNKSLLLCDGFRILGYGLSIGWALVLALRGDISIGLFGASIAAFRALQEETRIFLNDLGRLPEKVAFANDYFAFLQLPEEQMHNRSVEFQGLKDRIEIVNGSFAYPNSQKRAVEGISISIRKGEKIAILGENGSGKTTLSKLLLGLYEVSEGEVLYDGINVNVIKRSSLYKKVSAIAQNFVAYNLTLRENVAIGDVAEMNADRKINDALVDVGLGSVASSLGLDGELGREFDGAELSIGQWQKLAIARALYRDSELIVLDEPTSALDPLVETDILSRFIEIVKDRTAIIISHRVGLCRLVDRIVVMKDGFIAEIGTHKELMKIKGEYHKLYTSQEQWYE